MASMSRPGQGAHFETEAARRRDDVGCDAARDLGDLESGERRREAGVGRQGRKIAFDALQLGNQMCGGGDGVDAERRHAGMRGAAGDLDGPADRALVRVDDGHRGRLANDDGAGLRKPVAQFGDHRAHACAAGFLVVGEQQVDRRLERAALEGRHHRQRTGEIAFHVGGAAAVEAAIGLAQREGIRGPGGRVGGYDVGVAGEADAGHASRSDGGEHGGLLAVLGRDDLGFDAVAGQIVLHEGDDGAVGLVARRVEGHEALQQRDRR